MPRISPAQLTQKLRGMLPKGDHDALQRFVDAYNSAEIGLCEEEADLHAKITIHCHRERWLFFHGSMASKTHRTLGEPDFAIFVPGLEKPFYIECKTRTGKLSKEQQEVKHRMEAAGFNYHICRSYQQFLEIVK